MSVIEHGVPLKPYFEEMYRLLKPGGILITSTDYYPEPIDTRNKMAHEAPIKSSRDKRLATSSRWLTGLGLNQPGPSIWSAQRRPCAGTPTISNTHS